MSYVWKGVGLPWGPTIPSFIEPKEDIDILKTSVIFILLTRRGERVMLPSFGSAIPDALFEPNDPALQAIIETSVQEAIERWDDRIEFVSADAEIDPLDGNTLNIKVQWKNAKDPMAGSIQVLEFQLTPSMIGQL